MNYCAGYIRQQENQQLGVPPALVKTFPRRLQELVGYSVYNGLVGHIDKKHPAKVVLAEDEGRRHGLGSAQGLSRHLTQAPVLQPLGRGSAAGATGQT